MSHKIIQQGKIHERIGWFQTGCSREELYLCTITVMEPNYQKGNDSSLSGIGHYVCYMKPTSNHVVFAFTLEVIRPL